MDHQYEQKREQVGAFTAILAGDTDPWSYDPREDRETFERIIMWGPIGRDYAMGDDRIGEYGYAPDPLVECSTCEGNGHTVEGDECPRCEGTGEVEGTLREHLRESYDAQVCVFLHVSDYGGGNPLVVRFSDDEDGADGAAILTRKQLRDEFQGSARMGTDYIESVLREWAQWHAGEVYYYAVEDEHGNVVDMVHGFIGDDGAEYAMQEAIGSAQWHEDERLREAAEVAYWATRDIVTVGA